MTKFVIFTFCIGSLVALSQAGGGGHGGHDHVIIHVPYHVKTIKHTHTITKHIHHKSEGGGDHYEVLGYTVGHPIDLGGHGGGWHHGGHEGGNEIGGHFGGGFDGGQEEHGGY